jgi:hypothetical protein
MYSSWESLEIGRSPDPHLRWAVVNQPVIGLTILLKNTMEPPDLNISNFIASPPS